MLKVPDRIVIYPQKDSEPDHLLCWIPPSNYSFVSGDSMETETELREFYPTGIETELLQDSFDEFGISFPSNYDLDLLREAYLKLRKTGMFKELKFVNIKKLQRYVEKKDDLLIQDLVKKYSDQKITLEQLREEPIFAMLLEEPRSKGSQDPGIAFQQISGKL